MTERETTPRRKSILFICTGNTCRSAMAEALFRARLNDMQAEDMPNWRIESAGIMAEEGLPVSKLTRAVLEQRGIDVQSHRARTINRSLVQDFDLILTLTDHHKDAVSTEYPQISDRVFMLSEMSGVNEPVVDPYGEPLETYQQTADKIDRFLADGMPRILRLVQRRRSSGSH